MLKAWLNKCHINNSVQIIRTPLATALAAVAGNVYSFVPESVIPPAVVVVPDSALILELETINKCYNSHAKINFTISVAVAYNSNPASLDNIEQLIMSVLAVIPTGYVVSRLKDRQLHKLVHQRC